MKRGLPNSVPPESLEVPPLLAQDATPGSLDVVMIAYAGALPKLLRGRDFDQLAREAEAAFKGAGFEVTFRPAKHQPEK